MSWRNAPSASVSASVTCDVSGLVVTYRSTAPKRGNVMASAASASSWASASSVSPESTARSAQMSVNRGQDAVDVEPEISKDAIHLALLEELGGRSHHHHRTRCFVRVLGVG